MKLTDLTTEQRHNYDLGRICGELIAERDLISLNIDSPGTKHIVNVTEDEAVEAQRLHDIWFNEIQTKLHGDTNLFKNWLNYVKSLEKKYLPNKLEVYLPYMLITDKSSFRSGLSQSLWHSDMSLYMPEDDFLDQEDSIIKLTKITLTLS